MSERGHPHPGLFVCVAGEDGAYPRLASSALAEKLYDEGMRVTYVPGIEITNTGNAITRTLLDLNDKPTDPLAEALLYLSGRREALVQKIEPALRRGETVIVNGYNETTWAHQFAARGVSDGSWPEFKHLAGYAVRGILPDLNLIVTASAKISRERLDPLFAASTSDARAQALAYNRKAGEAILSYIKRMPQEAIKFDTDSNDFKDVGRRMFDSVKNYAAENSIELRRRTA